MKRDWDVIRDLLVKLEELPDTDHALYLEHFQEDQHFEISYHMRLVIEAGLVNGFMNDGIGSGPVEFEASSLTWEGHELLDAMRSDTVWGKTKRTVQKEGLNLTFDIVKALTTRYAMNLINGGPPM